MRAIVVDRLMEPRDLRVSEIADPIPGPGEVLVEVHAAACNFYDTLIVRGRYQVKPTLPFVPGGELAGVVLGLGAGVHDLALGARVFGSIVSGAYAERVCVPREALWRAPDGVPLESAATLPIAYGTAHAALVDRAGLASGETALIHAAAGGVGRAAVEIAHALGARVIATAGGDEKLAIARAAGADHAIDYRESSWEMRVLDLTGGRGADVVYDSVGGDTFDRSLRCIAWSGRLLVIGFSSGDIPTVRVNRVMLRNISIVGLHLPAYAEHAPARLRATYAALVDLLSAGRIRPDISVRLPLAGVPEALELLASRRSHGKIIIDPRA